MHHLAHPILHVLLVLLAVVVAVRLLRGLACRRRWHRGPPLRWLLRRIDATPEQERVLLDELESLRGLGAELREGLAGSRQELARALEADRLEPSALEAITAEPLRRLEAARRRAGESLARLHAALDPRQRRLLAARLRARHGRWHGPHARPC